MHEKKQLQELTRIMFYNCFHDVHEQITWVLMPHCQRIATCKINRGSYVSVRVSLNLLNELRVSDKTRGLPSIL